MASGYGRGGRGAALLQALQKPTRKPGQSEEETKTAQPAGPGAVDPKLAVIVPAPTSVPTPASTIPVSMGRGLGRGALLAGLLKQSQSSGAVVQPTPQPVSAERTPQPATTRATQPAAAQIPSAQTAPSVSTPVPATPVVRPPMGRGMAALRAALGASATRVVSPSAVPSPVQPTQSAVRPPVSQTATQQQPSPVKPTSPPPTSQQPPTQPPTTAMEGLSVTERRPTVSMQGSAGKSVHLSANYVKIKCVLKGVYQYHVDFKPEIDSKGMRIRLINNFREMFGPTKNFDGFMLYLPLKLEQEETVLESQKPTDSTPVTLTIKLVKVLAPESCVQLYNLIFRRIMYIQKMCQVGRYYYDPVRPINISQHKLEVWPGYITALQEHEGGLLLLLEASHRVLRTETVLQCMETISRSNPSQFRDQVIRTLVGSIVLTRYNNKTYRVDDIVWDKNPQHKFASSRTGEEMSFIEYYKKNYNKDIQDCGQPLLLHRPKKRSLPGGKQQEGGTEVICLIPELCYMTGLTDEIRQDFRVMKDIATHTRITPMQRQQVLRRFVDTITNSPECLKELSGWGLELDRDTLPLTGRLFGPEKIIFRNTQVMAGHQADWSRDTTKSSVISSVNLEKWGVFFVRRDQSKVTDFVKMMEMVCRPMGIDCRPPFQIALTDDRNETLIKRLRGNITNDVQLVVIVCPTSRDDKYSAIKKLCCVECPVPSQVIIGRTIGQQQKLRSVTQKIALQINCKLGGELWAMDIPLSGLMIVGIDSFHQKGKPSVGGFVASTNKRITRWYSRVCFQSAGQELIDGLKTCLIASIRKYHEVNHSLPEKIVVYRDGVGDGQLGVVADYEVKQLINCFTVFGVTYQPKLAVVIVQKRINTRLFLKMPDGKLDNPAPGSVVDHTITRREWYDFFLVSQHVRQGTVSPTHYVVVYDGSGMKPDHMQRLAYKMTHLYYNWPGTVRVPAACQYAHKLAYLVGEHIHKEPSQQLSDRLFFL